MLKVIPGIVRGTTIELRERVGVADGSEVEVTVRVKHSQRPWGEGILRSAGAMAEHWTQDDDRILAEIERDRKRSSGREIPE